MALTDTMSMTEDRKSPNILPFVKPLSQDQERELEQFMERYEAANDKSNALKPATFREPATYTEPRSYVSWIIYGLTGIMILIAVARWVFRVPAPM